LSYGQLFNHLAEIITQLNHFGIGRNDRVAIVLPNGPEMVTAFLGVAAAATCAPLNPNYRAPEFNFYLSDLAAKALLILKDMASPAREVAQTLKIPVIELSPLLTKGAGLFTLTGAAQPLTTEGGSSQPDDEALVLHTSGTTSRPKIVPLSQTNICISAHNISQTLQLTPTDRCLNVMPLFHIHGLMASTLASLRAGASLVSTPGFAADKLFPWLAEFQPTWYTAVPTMHHAILARAEANREVIRRNPLRLLRSSSSSLPPQVMVALEDIFSAPMIEAYGMTEAAHQMTSNTLPPGRRKAGSVGLAAGPQVRIMAEEKDEFLEQGQIGEIVIQGPNVTRGYANNIEANAKAFTADRWFRTGDQGYLDEEGYLFITGRLKEIINRGGETIAPREIDEALMNHPAIRQAVAFAVPHPTLQEDVAAAVILRSGSETSAKEIRAFAFEQLADYKVPSQILIVDEIPKGATGKLQRIGLADKLEKVLRSEFVPPRTSTEQHIAKIWQAVLKVEPVGIFDNFFAIGGDSLLAGQVVAQINAKFGVEIALPNFVE
jgi:acyl-CoA synthetase (AMP-forming)/AMP-acid ligase II